MKVCALIMSSVRMNAEAFRAASPLVLGEIKVLGSTT